MDAVEMDEASLYAQMEVDRVFGEFLHHFYQKRLPSPDEMSKALGVPVEDVNLALAAIAEEEV